MFKASKGNRRWLGRGLVAALLGVVTTFAVAWGGAYFEVAYRGTEVTQTLVFDTFTTHYFMTRGNTITRVGVTWGGNAQFASSNPSWIDVRTKRDLAHAPAWSKAWLDKRPARPAGTWGNWEHEATLNEFAAGWPMRALVCESDEGTPEPVTKLAIAPPTRGGFSLPYHVIRDGATIFLPRALPYRPLWLGFAVNTVLYSALWMPALCAGVIRRAWRLRHGRCLACGYDRRGLAAGARCPECGLEQTHGLDGATS